METRDFAEGGPVAVLAAGGKTAQAVLQALNRHGVPARPLTRSEADLDSGAGLLSALTGCSAAWLAVPNLHPDEPGVVARIVEACQQAGVPRLVYHSVAWPYAPSMRHHLDKAVGEDLVRRSGLRFTLLQPCAYLQNLLPACTAGRLRVPYSLDTRFALVDLNDVGHATAAVLRPPDQPPARPPSNSLDSPDRSSHDGATYELGGPAALSIRELAAMAQRVTGRHIDAEQTTWDEWVDGPGRSVPSDQLDRLQAMFDTYDRYGFTAGHLALTTLLGRPPANAETVLRREITNQR